MKPRTVKFSNLTESQRAEIEENIQHNFIWYLKSDGTLHAIERDQLARFNAEGGQPDTWSKIVGLPQE